MHGLMFPKPTKVRLRGKAYQELREAIFKRDKGRCVFCGKQASEHHHEPGGPDRSDEIHRGVALCSECHWDRHNSERGIEIKKYIREYLHRLYGDLYQWD